MGRPCPFECSTLRTARAQALLRPTRRLQPFRLGTPSKTRKAFPRADWPAESGRRGESAHRPRLRPAYESEVIAVWGCSPAACCRPNDGRTATPRARSAIHAAARTAMPRRALRRLMLYAKALQPVGHDIQVVVLTKRIEREPGRSARKATLALRPPPRDESRRRRHNAYSGCRASALASNVADSTMHRSRHCRRCRQSSRRAQPSTPCSRPRLYRTTDRRKK